MTVSEVVRESFVFDKRLAKARGDLEVGFESSVLEHTGCCERASWFVFRDGSLPLAPVIIVRPTESKNVRSNIDGGLKQLHAAHKKEKLKTAAIAAALGLRGNVRGTNRRQIRRLNSCE